MVFAWNDAWRKHPLLYNQKLSIGLVLPGFWWGAGAFAVFHGFTKFQNVRSVSTLTTPRLVPVCIQRLARSPFLIRKSKMPQYKNGSKDHGHDDHGHGHAEHADEAHGAAASHH